MPVNMPSHAHGQGYTDLNFLIPELVDYIDYRLGVYHTELGDFGSAGGAEFHLVRKLDRPFATVGRRRARTRAARDGRRRRDSAPAISCSAASSRPTTGRGRSPSGSGRPVASRGIRGSATASRFSVLGMAYRNRWNASDQIPQRAVEAGLHRALRASSTTPTAATRSATASPGRGIASARGRRSRRSCSASTPTSICSRTSRTSSTTRSAATSSTSVSGASSLAANVSHAQQVQALGVDHTVTVGLQTRADFLSPVGLYRTSDARVSAPSGRTTSPRRARGVFVEAQSRWRPWLRTTLGVRGDAYTFDVTSDRPENSGTTHGGDREPEGVRRLRARRAPPSCISAAGSASTATTRAARRSRSIRCTGDPARRVDPLVRSRGAEIGVAGQSVPGFRSTLAVWALELDSELLFIGDGGATEPSDRSRRSGVTFANFYRPIPQLSLDADVSLARARFAGVRSAEDHIPGALENVVAAGVDVEPAGARSVRRHPRAGTSARTRSSRTTASGPRRRRWSTRMPAC